MTTYKKFLIDGISLNAEYCGGFQNSYIEETVEWQDRKKIKVHPLSTNPVSGLFNKTNELPYSIKEEDLVTVKSEGDVEFVVLVNNSGIPEVENDKNKLKNAVGSSQKMLINRLREKINNQQDKISSLKDRLDEETESKEKKNRSQGNRITCQNCGATVSADRVAANGGLCPECGERARISRSIRGR